METQGILTFNYSIVGTCYVCHLEVIDQGYATRTYYWGSSRIIQFNLVPGHHSITINFHKMDTALETRSSRAVISYLGISGTVEGGASECLPCPVGSVSSGSVSSCSLCPAGTTNNTLSTECTNCPENTFNDRVGSYCIPCGSGTWSGPGSSECLTDCQYHYDANTVYDLTPLNSSSMYGPIDAKGHTFFLNVCHRENTNRTCFDEMGESTRSYACQIFPGNGWSYDIGRVLSYNPYVNPRGGVELAYSFGNAAYGCNGGRSTVLSLICDPLAGMGQLKPKDPVESPLCHYRFEWTSLYACPLCSSFDYDFQYTECVGGLQSKIYFWKDDPKLCRDGVSLPPREDNIPCTINTISCPAGTFLPPGESICQNCSAGYFSVGGGIEFSSWESIPAEFNTTCEGNQCSGWTAQDRSIVAGKGKSILTSIRNFMVEGSVTFHFKLYSPLPGVTFRFLIDGKEQFSSSYLVVDYIPITISSISVGQHTLTWEFINPTSNPLNLPVLAEIQKIRIVGTSFADFTCTPCPPGTFSEAQASTCNLCPAGTRSSAGSATCSPCPTRQYSFEGAETCVDRAPCTSNSVQILYTPCSNKQRTSYSVFLDPPCSTDSFFPPSNRTVACAPCLEGTYQDPSSGVCMSCITPDLYYDSSLQRCVASNPGAFIKRKQLFFFDNSLNRFPQGWITGCS